jgi:hypothetical protein
MIPGFAFDKVYGQLFPIVGMAPGGEIRANFGDQPFRWPDDQLHSSNNQSAEVGSTPAEVTMPAEESTSETPDETIAEGEPNETEVSGTEFEGLMRGGDGGDGER